MDKYGDEISGNVFTRNENCLIASNTPKAALVFYPVAKGLWRTYFRC